MTPLLMKNTALAVVPCSMSASPALTLERPLHADAPEGLLDATATSFSCERAVSRAMFPLERYIDDHNREFLAVK